LSPVASQLFMHRLALFVGLVCSANFSAPAAAADTDVDVSEVGPDTDVAPDASPDVVSDTTTDAGAGADATSDTRDDAALDAGDVALDSDAPVVEPRIHTLRVGVTLESRTADQAAVTVALTGPEDLEFALDAPGSIDVELQEGTYSGEFTAVGFDPVVRGAAVLGASEVHVALFPDQSVTFSGYVALGPSRLEGADIIVSGSRLSVPAQETSGADGLFAFEELPAGFYDVRVSFDGGFPAERREVDMLGDTEINFSLPLVVEERDVTTSRSFCASGRSGGAVWLAGLALLALRRRR
jgi:MYXO-CTERM domain-containing protein